MRRGLLHKVRGRGTIFRTLFYANDVVVFVTPFKEDIQNLSCILRGFDEVTALKANFHKSMVAHIRCRHLDLEAILEGLPAMRSSLPMRYLGLPLSVW